MVLKRRYSKDATFYLFTQNFTHPNFWDGKNELGESVASDIYVYTLTAGDFSATRKMCILK